MSKAPIMTNHLAMEFFFESFHLQIYLKLKILPPAFVCKFVKGRFEIPTRNHHHRTMKITVECLIKSDPESVWNAWINPDDITRWNAASDDWHTPEARVDFRVGGRQWARMEARDGSAGFDFVATFTKIEPHRVIEMLLDDGRNVRVEFHPMQEGTMVRETFDAESENDPELQRSGWQAILDNFKRHVEGRDKPLH